MGDEEQESLLARLDERVKAMQKELHEGRQQMHNELNALRKAFSDYVTKMEFWPVKMISMGLAGLILAAVVAAIVARVLHQ